MSAEQFYNREFSIPPGEHPMLRITYPDSSERVDTSLNEFLKSNDGLTDDEIYALSNLKLNEYYDMGVHFGWVTIHRIK